MWDLVKEGVTSLVEKTTDEEKAAHKELKKKDNKALFIIHQCVDPEYFKKLSDVELVKEAWEILDKSFEGVEKVKEVKLQTYKRKCELLKMGECESITDFFTRVTKLVNRIKVAARKRSKTSKKPEVSHLAATKMILRYLKGTLIYGIMFPTSDVRKECKLVGYTDSDWCSDGEDRKFTVGYVFILGGAPVA
ncbi:uncharacterized protein LOC127121623 [Lathyrus oleraceus]|uniref:uncharacterized protein LOC127121623 n=1 Tax=Pisum sativum TaxID=3888 RepID=UPI0021CF2392|nr:uncharacterized protein LOC127121623 [Pisum sativum]